jgi:hypothetical protein
MEFEIQAGILGEILLLGLLLEACERAADISVVEISPAHTQTHTHTKEKRKKERKKNKE